MCSINPRQFCKIEAICVDSYILQFNYLINTVGYTCVRSQTKVTDDVKNNKIEMGMGVCVISLNRLIKDGRWKDSTGTLLVVVVL